MTHLKISVLAKWECVYALLIFGIMFEMAIRMHLKIFAR